MFGRQQCAAAGRQREARLTAVCAGVGLVIAVALVLSCAPTGERAVLFFCGCHACAELAQALGPDRLTNADVYFRGSEGDARQFQERHRLKRTVRADGDGAVASRYGVKTCPSVVILGEVIGNGRGIKASDVTRVADVLEEDS